MLAAVVIVRSALTTVGSLPGRMLAQPARSRIAAGRMYFRFVIGFASVYGPTVNPVGVVGSGGSVTIIFALSARIFDALTP